MKSGLVIKMIKTKRKTVEAFKPYGTAIFYQNFE